MGSSGSSASGLGSSASGSGSSGLGSSAASPARGSGQPATATPNRPPSRRDHQTPSKLDVAGPNGPSGLAAKRTSRPTTKYQRVISVTDLLGGSDALDKLVEQTSGGAKPKPVSKLRSFLTQYLRLFGGGLTRRRAARATVTIICAGRPKRGAGQTFVKRCQERTTRTSSRLGGRSEKRQSGNEQQA